MNIEPNTLSAIAVITALVQIVVMIVFFVMAGHVAAIRKATRKDAAYWRNEIDRLQAFGLTQQLKEATIQYIWAEYNRLRERYNYEPQYIEEMYKFEEEMNPLLKQVGIAWPKQLSKQKDPD